MGEIKCLTALRGIAAMVVVIEHFSATVEHHATRSVPSIVGHGYLAVDLFFVLSGFIMAYTYLAGFEATGMRAYAGFLGKRVARIVPLNIAVLLAIVAGGAISSAWIGRNILYSSSNLPADLLANILMLQGVGIGTNLNGPSWTISTEFVAYLLFPAFLWLMFHRHRFVAIAGFVAAIVVLCAFANQQPRLGLTEGGIAQGLARCFTQFVTGLGAYRLYRARARFPWLGSDAVSFGAMGVSVAFLALRIDLLTVLPFPLLIASLAANQGRAARWLALPFPYFLGVVSYSIYLIHNAFRPIGLELLQYFHPAPVSLPAALALALIGSFSVVPVAWLAYRFIERPGRVMVRALLGGA